MDSRDEYVRMKWVSNNTGMVYAPQAQSVVALATAMFDKVEVSFDQVNMLVSVCVRRYISDLEYHRFFTSTRSVLGENWKVHFEEKPSAFHRFKRWLRGRQD